MEDSGNQLRVTGAVVLLGMFVFGMFYRPILWLFMGVSFIGLLLLFLYISSAKASRGPVSTKPSHAALNRAQRSYGRPGGSGGGSNGKDDDSNPLSNTNQIAFLVVGLIIGFMVIVLS